MTDLMQNEPTGYKGLRFKFVAAISIILLCTLSGAAFYVFSAQERLLLDNLKNKIDSIGQFVSLVSPGAIYSYDITSLDRFVKRIEDDKDVIFSIIYGPNNLPMTTMLPEGMSWETAKTLLTTHEGPPHARLLKFPIKDGDETIGTILIGVDDVHVKQIARQGLIEQLLIYFFIIIFLSSMIFYIFYRYVLRPINYLVSGSNRISLGDFEKSVPILSQDEMGYLAACFNNMTMRIKDEQAKLHLANKELENELAFRKKAEDNLMLAASVFTSAKEGITITDKNANIIDVNEAFSQITGYQKHEVLGKNPRILQSGRHTPDFYKAIWESLNSIGYWSGEIWNRHKNGSLIAEMLTISAVKNDEGEVLHYVALFADITPQKRHQQQLEFIAHYDSLTRLPNRILFADRLHQGMIQTQRREQILAVVYLDLDGFKEVNDTHGHDIGDRLLIILSERFKNVLREGDTIARLGGDEFVAILLDLDEKDDCLPLVNRLLDAAVTTAHADHLNLNVSASVGITFYPQGKNISEDEILRQADQAMYKAKQGGKNRYHIYNPETDEQTYGKHESRLRIAEALKNKEFELYYQPIVNLRTGEVINVEALIRWNHPEQGVLPPYHFLPTIEDSKLALTVEEWVIKEAIQQVAKWNAQGLNLNVSINISAHHLQHHGFIDELEATLKKHPDVSPKQIEFELQETSKLEDIKHIALLMQQCARMGIKFTLDDYGKGYSSLNYLKQLPIKSMKMDQSFIKDMLFDPGDFAIIKGILGLAHAFRREAVAKGVENQEYCALLMRLGCDVMQGFHISRPLQSTALVEWLKDWQVNPKVNHFTRVPLEDLPVLFANVEHRQWVKAMHDYVGGKRSALPPLARSECRFSKWLNNEGEKRYSDHPAYKDIERLHNDIHQTGYQISELQKAGKTNDTKDMLFQLDNIRDRLLKKLDLLLTK